MPWKYHRHRWSAWSKETAEYISGFYLKRFCLICGEKSTKHYD